MGVLDNLQPTSVFKYFEEICSIPHGSRNLQQISDYLVNFAKERGLKYRQDEELNVIIWKDASAGYEDATPVIIQGHMDMVAVKEPGCTKDLATEGLDLEINGDYISATGTSLGGDDGIAVAYALAILDDDTLAHPPLEAVITTNEEIGLLGAAALDTSDLKGKILLNADSEDEGIFTVACAGGATAISDIQLERESTNLEAIELRLHSLTGGHSGAEIHKDRGNASYIMARILMRLDSKYGIRLYTIDGGEKDNAITIENTATVVVGSATNDEVISFVNELFEDIKAEYADTDPNMALDIKTVAVGENLTEGTYDGQVMTEESTMSVISQIIHLPQGVVRMSHEIEGLVQTSMNLGVVKTEGNNAQFIYSVRSSKASEKEQLLELIKHMTAYVGGTTIIEGDYPGWDYNPDNKIEGIMVNEYKKLYGEEPKVEGIHAGLECGLMIDKMPGLEAISFGPQMHAIHTFKEELSISSTKRTWDLLINTLAAIR